MFDFRWVGVVFQPFDIEWEPCKKMIPVLEKKFGHPPLDVSLFLCVHSYTINRRRIDGRIA